MKSAKMMRVTVLMIAVAAVAGVMAVLACGPASSAQQTSGRGEKERPTETPTPTPTLHPDCVTLPLPDGSRVTSCPPPGPENVESNLRRHYNRVMATKEANAGRRAVFEPLYVDIVVDTDSVATMHVVAEFLESYEDVGKIDLQSHPSHYGAAALIVGHVRVELIPAIAAIEGVVRVEKERKPVPLSSQGQPAPNLAVLARMGVDDWHQAGITGSGVGVAVIDSGFKDFRTRVMPSLSEPAKFLCYDSDREAHEGYVPTLTPTPGATPVVTPGPTPTPKFVACEEGADDHGTVIVETLFEVAPDVNLRIARAGRPAEYVQAVEWLTAGRSDNTIAATRVYDVRANDEHNVKIINHSGGDVWDGPGDGTSDFVSDERRSLLNIVKDAEDGGAVWVNAAGNNALQTWYSTFVPFNNPVDGIQYLDFSSIRYSFTGGNNPCNRVTFEADKDYTLQARWDGDWEGDDVDLEVHLVREAGTDGDGNPLPRLMVSSTGRQAGPGTDPPFEKLEFSTGADIGGDYCVFVTRDSGDRVLGWLQFQIFSGGGDVVFHTKTGSITNPAESASDGMLAVGAGKFRVVLPEQLPPAPTPFPTAVVDLWDYSARGPVPEIPAHVKPELVGINTDVLGTSDAAPQVAGVAALVAQVSGSSVSPRHLARSLLDHRDGGAHGLVQLPSLEAPTGVTVSHDTCSGRGFVAQFSHPSLGSSLVSFEVRAVQVLADGSSGAVFGSSSRGFGTTHVDTGSDRGAYDVTARACAGSGYCGPWSSPPTRFATTAQVCRPSWFRVVPGDGQATLWWSPDPDATGYQVDSGEGTDPVSVTGEEHVIDGLTNGTTYRYRLRALGPGGPSDWTSPRSVTPRESRSRLSEPTDLRAVENDSRRFPGVALSWDAPFGSHLYEIRVLGGGASTWKRLPFQPAGWDSPYSARYFGSYGRVGDEADRAINVGEAIIAGLVPGTEYHFAVRTARERDASEKLDYSPWSEPVTLTTPGQRPANAPGNAAAPRLKAPPEDLMAEVSGTTVNLSWTAATNPNYTSQRLLRRVAGVSPIQWTEIPLDVGVTTYTDTGLTSGTTYRYRVRAYKDNGNYGEEQGGFADAVIP